MEKKAFHLLVTCNMLMNVQQDRAEQVFDSTHQPPCVATSNEPGVQAGISWYGLTSAVVTSLMMTAEMFLEIVV